jgi:hypothetical protein
MALSDPIFEKLKEIPDPAPGMEEQTVPAIQAPAEPSPTRQGRRLRALLALAVALAWTGFVLVDLGTRPDIGAGHVLIPLLVWMSSAVVALLLVFRRGERGLPPGVRVVQIVAVALPLLFLGIAAAVTIGSGGSTPFTWKTLSPCMAWSGIAGAGPMIVSALLLRRSFLSAPVWRGAAVGAVCGLTASVLIHAHCPAPGASHVLMAHGFPVVSGALLGALFGALGGRV